MAVAKGLKREERWGNRGGCGRWRERWQTDDREREGGEVRVYRGD